MGDLSEVVPKELLERGINLEEIGICEYAWDKDTVQDVIKYLLQEKIPIYGGDVYISKDNKVELTYDNWYIDDDGSEDFYLKSYEKALKYITELEANTNTKNLYTVVI